MIRPFRTSLLAGVAAALLSAAPLASARAQAAGTPVTAAQATAVEVQFRNWLGAMLGSSVHLADQPVHVTPAGDHFDVRVVLFPRAEANGGDIVMTATARPVEGGRWDIDNLRQTNPLKFSIDMPVPNDDATGTKTATVHYTVDVKSQGSRIQLDPALASPTTYSSSSTGLTAHTEGGLMIQDSTAGAINSVMSIRPAGADRVDISAEGSAQDYHIVQRVGDTPSMDINMGRVRATMSLTGVSRDHAVLLTRTMATILSQSFAGMPAEGQPLPTTPPKIAPELTDALLTTLQDFASEGILDESVQNLTVKIEDLLVAIKEMRVAFAGKSDNGLLQASMDIGVNGLGLDGLPMDDFDALVPTVIDFKPFVSGVDINALVKMAKDNKGQHDPTPEQINALFGRGGITTGLESMTLAVGGATFTGQAKLLFTSPQRFTGSGTILAEKIDDLIEKLNANPMTARGVPGIALLKGYGKMVDNKMVWNVSYDGAKLLVNNVDVLAMAAPAPRPTPAPRP